ncbi:C4-type zinc ribbon domain-containing protein [Microbacterium sp. ARD31]|uniref:zinc ribbon domain-containing protein n=1 Tax=Microbacterium sp. ARD31 TaxID=2962576 RepID=UPI0028823BC4|nr:C4-type zinc ribbon domain-containing protein [Microbacterium sp. ARD31]MDT0186946.1 C4-type zinc ribbon domain-containing protein [Microbacterium sp. ARD31]
MLLKADPTHQVKLLDVAELDSRAAQLRHQRAHLPELAEIASLESERTEITDQVRDARIVVDDLTVEQAKADREVEQVRARRERDRTRMDAGQVTNPKDLERMQHELVSLERRITTLEDAELEVMEALEQAQQVLDALGIRADDVDAKLAELVAARDEKRAAIDASLEEVSAARGPATEGMPEDLMALYERLREQKGIGAALLRARQCGGCNMTLDASELSRIKAAPADEVIRCEECQRILVRTDESGL